MYIYFIYTPPCRVITPKRSGSLFRAPPDGHFSSAEKAVLKVSRSDQALQPGSFLGNDSSPQFSMNFHDNSKIEFLVPNYVNVQKRMQIRI